MHVRFTKTLRRNSDELSFITKFGEVSAAQIPQACSNSPHKLEKHLK
jgi:hypothetical protein